MRKKSLWKQTAAMLLAGTMVLSAAGCGPQEQGESSSQPTENQESSGASDSGNAEEPGTDGQQEGQVDPNNPWAALDLSEHETVNCYVIGSLGTDWESVTQKAVALIEEKTNTTVNFVHVPWSDFQSKYNLFLTGDEDVDMIYAASWTGFADYVRSEAYTPFDMEFVKTWMPLTYQNQPEESWEVATFDGKIYGIPPASSWLGGNGFVTTQDLLDKYGFKAEDIKNMDDLEEYLLAVAAGDNDGLFAFNPQNSYPLDSDLLGYHTFGIDAGNITWMLYNYDYDKLGTDEAFDPDKLEWFAESDNYRDFVLKMAKWNKAGVFPANIMANGTMLNDNFQEGKSAVMGSDPYGASSLRATMKERGKEVVYLDCSFDDKSVSMRGGYYGYTTCFPVHSEKMERSAVVLDCMKYDEEVHLLLMGGIEGEHYILDRETNTRDLGPRAEAYPWGGWLYWIQNNDDPAAKIDEDLQKYQDKYLAAEVSMDNFPVSGFSYNGTQYEAELAVLNALFNEYRFSFCFGVFQDNTEAKLEEFIRRCKEAGIDDIIADYKRQVKEYTENLN